MVNPLGPAEADWGRAELIELATWVVAVRACWDPPAAAPEPAAEAAAEAEAEDWAYAEPRRERRRACLTKDMMRVGVDGLCTINECGLERCSLLSEMNARKGLDDATGIRAVGRRCTREKPRLDREAWVWC